MESKSLVICDPEEQYAQSLALYIMNQKWIHFQVHVCNALKQVNKADLLLISDVFPEEERKKLKTDKTIVLTDGVPDSCIESMIYKYQTGEQIVNAVLEYCEEVYKSSELFFTSNHKKSGKIVGIFSPVHRIGKTAYALDLGERLSDTENVLYISLELYGGIGGHFDSGEQTLEDVLYYARQEKGNLGYILAKAVKHKGKLDYLLPVSVSEDIKVIPAKEWIELFRRILSQSIYEIIILDIDEGIRDVYEILKVCSKIYLLTDKTSYSMAKVAQFEKELALLGYQDVLARLERKEEEND